MSPAIGLKATLDAVVAALVAADITASVDPAKINLPGVWASLGALSPELLDGGGTVTVKLNLICADVLYPDAVGMLDTLLGDVLMVVDAEGDIVPESVVMPDSPNPLPSLRVTILRPYHPTTT